MDLLLSILKDFGFPVALCGALLWAIMRQNAMLVKSYTDRISTLERVVRELQNKLADLEDSRLKQANDYASSLREIASRYAAVIRDHNGWNEKITVVLANLVDSIRFTPCRMQHEHQPHSLPRSPSSADIPAPPVAKADDTTRTFNGQDRPVR